MKVSNKLKKTLKALESRGKDAYKIARTGMCSEKFEYRPINEAVQYFMNEHGRNFYHPALLSLACELVGGKHKYLASVGASLVLLTGAADIHDDIIDKSKVKGSKATVLGKYGEDVALLVGNALILKGCALLHEICRDLPLTQGAIIYNLVKEGFFGLIAAEAKEACFKGNWDLSPEEYFHIMEMKASLSEATTQIGAILGNATSEQVKDLKELGKILGFLVNVRNEFIDIYEKEELQNRAKHECLPLPMFYAFLDSKLKNKITSILCKENFTEDDAFEIARLVAEAEGVKELKIKMHTLAKRGLEILIKFKQTNANELLTTLLQMVMSDL
jgi:geranylgeranyl pyrophosphate synthase